MGSVQFIDISEVVVKLCAPSSWHLSSQLNPSTFVSRGQKCAPENIPALAITPHVNTSLIESSDYCLPEEKIFLKKWILHFVTIPLNRTYLHESIGMKYGISGTKSRYGQNPTLTRHF